EVTRRPRRAVVLIPRHRRDDRVEGTPGRIVRGEVVRVLTVWILLVTEGEHLRGVHPCDESGGGLLRGADGGSRYVARRRQDDRRPMGGGRAVDLEHQDGCANEGHRPASYA